MTASQPQHFKHVLLQQPSSHTPPSIVIRDTAKMPKDKSKSLVLSEREWGLELLCRINKQRELICVGMTSREHNHKESTHKGVN